MVSVQGALLHTVTASSPIHSDRWTFNLNHEHPNSSYEASLWLLRVRFEQ